MFTCTRIRVISHQNIVQQFIAINKKDLWVLFRLQISKQKLKRKFQIWALFYWCTSQWSLEVKTYSILWKVFKDYSFWIRIWLTSNLSLETIFSLFSRSILLTGNTKSVVRSISVLNLWYFGYIFLMSNLHTLSCHTAI